MKNFWSKLVLGVFGAVLIVSLAFVSLALFFTDNNILGFVAICFALYIYKLVSGNLKESEDNKYSPPKAVGAISSKAFTSNLGESRKSWDRKEKEVGVRESDNTLEGHWLEVYQNKDLWIDIVGEWYYKEPTERQIEKLSELEQANVQVSGESVTRGVLSDMIGKHYPADDEDLDQMRALGASYPNNLTQTQARVKLRKLMVKPENQEAWKKFKGKVYETLDPHWEKILKNKAEYIEEVGDWYFKEPSARQLERADSFDYDLKDISRKRLTRGMVSDLIGMEFRLDIDDRRLAVMKYFGVDIAENIVETEASIATRELMLVPGNKAAYNQWVLDESSADKMFREQLRFYGEDPPSNLTHGKAMKILKSMFRSDEQNADWEVYKGMWADFEKGDFRKKHNIKKFNMKTYRDLVRVLYSEGIRLSDPKCSSEFVSERLLLLHPKLKRL